MMFKKSNKDIQSVTRFILNSIKPYPWQILGLIIVACYWAVHISLQPYLIKLIIDRVNQVPSLHNVWLPVTLYIVIAFLFTLNFRFYDWVGLHFYPKIKAQIMQDSTEIIRHYSYAFFQNRFSGELSDKIKNLSKGTADIIQILIDRLFSHILAFLIACGTLALVNIWLSAILLVWTILLLTISIMSSKRGRKLSHGLSEANSHLIGRVVDQFANIINVKLFSTYAYERKELNHSLSKTIAKDQQLRWFLLKLMTVQGLATAGMLSGCLLILIVNVQSHHITVGDFALVFTLTISFAEIIWHLAQDIAHFSEIYGMVSQGIQLLNSQQKIVDIDNAKELKIVKGEIRFEKVHFHYENAETLFSNKSIILHAGEKVGLVGFSGGGKSTFASLILRLFDVNSGKITIDDQDISKVTQDSLHHSITMIPQDPVLFHRSLKENIRYGRLEASDQEVIEASKGAHAHEFISILPQGYDTLVGERGIKLSGGQRQRVAIARAILKNSPILLMDEATSALDSVTENIIKNTLIQLMKGKTTIVIAHRLSTLLHMDRILVFDRGKVVEDGKHQELLSKGGLYKKLWDAQVGGFIPDTFH